MLSRSGRSTVGLRVCAVGRVLREPQTQAGRGRAAEGMLLWRLREPPALAAGLCACVRVHVGVYVCTHTGMCVRVRACTCARTWQVPEPSLCSTLFELPEPDTRAFFSSL